MTVLTKEEDVSNEVMRRLALNTIALGAETDIGARVIAGATKPDADQMPCTVLIEADDVPESRNVSASYKTSPRYVAFAYVKFTGDDPRPAAHAALRDLKRCIWSTDGKPDSNWARQVVEVEYLGREFAPVAPSEKFIGVAMEFAVTFAQNLANP